MTRAGARPGFDGLKAGVCGDSKEEFFTTKGHGGPRRRNNGASRGRWVEHRAKRPNESLARWPFVVKKSCSRQRPARISRDIRGQKIQVVLRPGCRPALTPEHWPVNAKARSRGPPR